MEYDPYAASFVLTGPECWEMLGAADVGRLAISIANHPDIFPVNFVVDGETVVFRTAEGTKLAGAVLGKSVAFESDGASGGDAWSVVVKGSATEIEEMYERFDAEELPLYPWNAAPKHRFVRIVPESITGRRFQIVEHPARRP